MEIDARTVESLAPDQSSLKAAAGLKKPGKWSGISIAQDGCLIWGECAGSGANPYRVAVDLRDHGTKCTCPSRKFPCKHALALMWMKADGNVPFASAEAAEWVGDWLRRRRSGAAKPSATGNKDLATASTDEAEAEEYPKVKAKREAAAAKRSADTDLAIGSALDSLDQWIDDQIRTGLSGFMEDMTARCRRIASRMVDGKAPTLAARIDEMPSRILSVAVGDRSRTCIDELGKLVLLGKAFRRDPRDPQIRRAITSAENRDTLMADDKAIKVRSAWEVLHEGIVTRRDGLIAQTTWLLNLGEGPRFAMLLDFSPASAGRRGTSFSPGERFSATIAFYRADDPLRALLIERHPDPVEQDGWPSFAGEEVSRSVRRRLVAEPWTIDIPVMLPAGRIVFDRQGAPWWRSACGAMIHPVQSDVPPVACGSDLFQTAALWNANRLELLAATTPWGRVDCHA